MTRTCLLALFGACLAPWARSTVYVGMQTGLLGTMDPRTGQYSEIGEMVADGDVFATTMLDIAVDRTGMVYGSSLNGDLFRIDPKETWTFQRFGETVTAVRTAKIGPQGLTFAVDSLAFNPVDERLYGYDHDYLYTLDTATGRATRVSDFLDPNRPNVMGDFAFNAEGQLHGFSHIWTYRFNLATGIAEQVGAHGFLGALGCAFEGPILYGYSQHEREVFGYDVVTNSVVSHVPYVGAPGMWAVYGAASHPVPEPATWMVLGGSALLVARRRRR